MIPLFRCLFFTGSNEVVTQAITINWFETHSNGCYFRTLVSLLRYKAFRYRRKIVMSFI